MRRALLVSIVLLTLVAPLARVVPAHGSPPLHDIIKAEDARSGIALEPLTRDTDPQVRARAVRALGRLQDPQYLGCFTERTRDDDGKVRAEAIFAIGQLDSGLAESPLLDLLGTTRPLDERLLVITAVGRVAAGDGAGHVRLVSLLADSDPAVRAKAALALEDLAYRLRRVSPPWIPPAADVQALLPLLVPSQPVDVRVAAAGALTRFAWLPQSKTRTAPAWAVSALAALKPLLKAPEADVRMRALQAIGEVAAPDLLPTEVGRALTDADWRVRVAAVDSVGRAAPAGRTWPVLLAQELQDPHALVVLVSLRSLEALANRHHTKPGRDVYGVYLDVARPLQVRADALRIAVAFQDFGGQPAPLPFGAAGPASPHGRVVTDAWKKVWRLRRALAEGSAAYLVSDVKDLTAETLFSQYQVTLRPFLTDPDARVRGAAVEACGAMLRAASSIVPVVDAKPSDEVATAMRGDLFARLADKDEVVRATAAGVAAELGLKSAVPAIVDSLEKMRSAKDAEAMVSLIEALGALRDVRALPLLETLSRDDSDAVATAAVKAAAAVHGEAPRFEMRSRKVTAVSSEALAFVDAQTAPGARPLRAVIHTRYGDVTVRLFVAEAPLTVYSFVKLARAGYFDGLTFHRVVPNFVAQGGDPRGDGWGGPGYTIRCEVNPVPYQRGTVGMALAGKDTGGSQFFITHSPQPRLNGRYTVFGQVVTGLDVLDRLTEGDSMRIEVLEPQSLAPGRS